MPIDAGATTTPAPACMKWACLMSATPRSPPSDFLFCKDTRADKAAATPMRPASILFNGGVCNPQFCANVSLMFWPSGSMIQRRLAALSDRPSLDLAVAWGDVFRLAQTLRGTPDRGRHRPFLLCGHPQRRPQKRNEDNNAVRRPATFGRGPGDNPGWRTRTGPGATGALPAVYFNGSSRQSGRRFTTCRLATSTTAALAHHTSWRQKERHAHDGVSSHVGGAVPKSAPWSFTASPRKGTIAGV